MPSFITDTPEKLKVELVLAQKSNLVAITGDRVKVLYEGEDRNEAQAVYDEAKEHFDARVTERAKGKDAQGIDMESKVEFKPRKKARF